MICAYEPTFGYIKKIHEREINNILPLADSLLSKQDILNTATH